MKTCDICIEEECKGEKTCNCETCTNKDKCPKYRGIHPTIRITNKCTQRCDHCCFASSPSSNIMMSISTAKEISTFLEKNEIKTVNLMGGEFFCNPDWYDILRTIIDTPSIKIARLVTNGDWAGIDEVEIKLKSLIEEYKQKFYLSLSKDKWHTNKKVESAINFLEAAGGFYNIAKKEDTTDNSIVPVGRAIFHYGIYSTMGCYCHNPVQKYSILIDEEGNIYQCNFGMFKFAEVKDYVSGGFAERFKEYKQKFYKVFISSCGSCSRFESYCTIEEKKCFIKRE